MGNRLWGKSSNTDDDHLDSSLGNYSGFTFDIEQIIKIKNHPID